MEDKPKIQFLALWENQDKNGNVYLSGTLGRNRVIAFKNSYKERDNQPDWVVYLQPKPDEQPNNHGQRSAYQKPGVHDGPRGTLVVGGQGNQPPADNTRPPDGMF